MATDPFDDLLDLENGYYKEGHDAGVADSTYAGMIEGRVFGIEKGYEKALELGKLHGRALVWRERFPHQEKRDVDEEADTSSSDASYPSRIKDIMQDLPQLSDSARLRRHVEGLQATSGSSTIAKGNSDEAVTNFDDQIAKAKAKAKVIANIAGEPLNPTSTANAGIEDATGLQARH